MTQPLVASGRKLLGLLGVIACLPVAVANATPVLITVGSPSGGTAAIHAPGTIANGLSVYLGSVAIGGGLGTFEGYCVDLQHFSGSSPEYAEADSMRNWGTADTTITNGNPARLGSNAAAWLYNTYAVGANNTGRAALQLAIWNALYDTDTTVLGGGGFSVYSTESAYTDLADQMLDAYVRAGSPMADAMWIRTLNSEGGYSQDYIGPQPVPEPASLLLFGTGLLGVAGSLRRRLRKNARG